MSPMVYILWSCAVALYHSVQGQLEECRKAVDEALAHAERTGLHAFDFLLVAQMARCSLIAGDPHTSERWIAAMAGTMRSHSHINGAFHRHLQCNAAAQRGDWQQALDHGRSGLAMALESGVPFVIAHCHIDLARALLGGGGPDWASHLHAARRIGQAMGSRVVDYLCLEAEAEAAFDAGEDALGLEHLAHALALSRAMGGATWLMAGPRASARLYDRALNAGIEIDHVQRLIRRHRLIPPDPATAAESWPWPVCVYTLGRFEILRDGQPLRSAGKAQRKPLELLKCLCAFGGHAVNQDRVADALWQDTDGDAADQALRTTLHRLRKLLQHEQAVRLEDRHLYLDPRYLWADCLAFDRIAHHPRMADRSSLQRALNRYRGPFLAGESAPWALAFRERLRAHYMSMAERLGALLEQEGDWAGAADCYLRAIEVEPVAETFYRRLMNAYARLGRPAEALAVYQRCRQSLLTRLGVSPTQETRSLLQQLGGH
jgi:DNA-binding SARP family transcriptional activator